MYQKFKDKFNIELICEFYAATEGNVALFDATNTQGSLGFIPPILQGLYPIKVLRADVDAAEPLRNSKTGFCEECTFGEVGLLVGKIEASRRFDGYSDEEATRKKILRNGSFQLLLLLPLFSQFYF